MQVLFLFVQKWYKFVSYYPIIGLKHAIPSQDVEGISSESDRQIIVCVLYIENALEKLQFVLKVISNVLQRLLVIVLCD